MREAVACASDIAGDHPIDRLTSLVRTGASGELVAATESLEAHVYIIGGRVAWATSSRAPNELARYLHDRCGIDRAALRSVIAECQRTGGRFGEMLVAQRIATAAQVRTALRTQIESALAAIAELAEARTLFFPRSLSYARDLTFDLDEVLFGAERAPDPRALTALSEALPALRWSVLLGTRGREERAIGPEPAPPSALLRTLTACLEDCGDTELALRSHVGAIVAHASADARGWAVCGLRPDANFGLSCAVLAHTMGRRVPTAPPSPRRATWGEWIEAPREDIVSSLEPMKTAMDQCEHLLAAVVALPDRGDAGAIVRRREFDVSSTVDRALTVGGLVPMSLAGQFAAPQPDCEHITYERVTCCTGDASVRWFGAIVRPRPRAVLWLAIERSAPMGFGWTLLTTLTRQLESVVVA